MGYLTQFSLIWQEPPGYIGKPNCQHAHSAKFCPECGTAAGVQGLSALVARYIEDRPDDIGYALESDGSTGEGCKWYEWEEHMRDMSKQFPGVLFTLHGEGEENHDIWNAYFRDGLMQLAKAQVVIAPFDAAELK